MRLALNFASPISSNFDTAPLVPKVLPSTAGVNLSVGSNITFCSGCGLDPTGNIALNWSESPGKLGS